MNKLIFGHTWDAIQRAQQGGKLNQAIIPSDDLQLCADQDMELFKRHGMEGLEKLQFYGVIDRLKNSKVI